MSDESALVAGVDLGGTKILTLVVDGSMHEVARDQRPSEGHEGGPDVVIQHMADSVKAASVGRSIEVVGISTAGPVDLVRGVVTEPPNLRGWQDVALAKRLEEATGIPCVMQHDGKCGAIAEYRLGVGRGTQHMIYVTLGTGVGGGIILDGKIYIGASGGAGEIGHMVVEPQGRLCNCGRRGCLEAMCAGYYLGLDAQDIIKTEPEGILAEIVAKAGTPPDAKLLSDAAEAGDESADAAIRRAGAYLGAGLTNLVNVFNPQLIVLGGSLINLGLRYLEPALAVPKRDAFKQHYGDVRIEIASLGEEAPAMGAALLARDKLVSGQ
jgi:glucokinase